MALFECYPSKMSIICTVNDDFLYSQWNCLLEFLVLFSQRLFPDFMPYDLAAMMDFWLWFVTIYNEYVF